MCSLKIYRTVLSVQVSRKDQLPRFFNEISINLDKFLKEFIVRIEGLPFYFSLIVAVKVRSDRNFELDFVLPSAGFFINLLSFVYIQKIVYLNRVNLVKNVAISSSELCKLCMFKYSKCNFSEYTAVLSTSRSMGLLVIY